MQDDLIPNRYRSGRFQRLMARWLSASICAAALGLVANGAGPLGAGYLGAAEDFGGNDVGAAAVSLAPLSSTSRQAEPEAGVVRRRIFLPVVRIDGDQAQRVVFSRSRGYIDQPFDLTLHSPTRGARIVFTLDGSAPTASTGQQYIAPIRIGTTTVVRAAALHPALSPSPVETHTYIVPDHVIRQSNHPRGFPHRWGTFEDEPVESDYAMDPEVVEDPLYSGRIVGDLRSLPAVSVALAPWDLFESGGIYANPLEKGRAWERPASVEIIDGDSATVLQIDAGARIAGQFSRQPDANRKHSISLRFRSEYGFTKLDGRLFEGSPANEFDALRLRAGQADTFEFFPGKAQYLHDEWGRRTHAEMGSAAARGIFVHLYLNGLYWGLYNLVEEIDEEFAEEHLGGHKEDYDIIKQVVDEGPVVEAGNREAFDRVLAIDPSTRQGYEELGEILDLVQYVDYTLLQMYAGNRDWPHNNWIALRRRAPGHRFKFMVWDIEQMTQLWEYDPYEDRTWTDGAAGLHGRLKANPDYRMLFADRVQKHMFSGGALSPEATAARYAALASEVEPAIVAESARWGDVVPEVGDKSYAQNRDAWDDYWRRNGVGHPQSLWDEWIPERDRLLRSFFPTRSAVIVDQLRRQGLFSTVAAPRIEVRGRTLRIRGGDGLVYYTLDGSDPRAPGGALSPVARVYDAPILLPSYASIKARGRLGNEWSPLAELTAGEARLAVSEINYHPAGDADTEFVELFNPTEASVDLSGAAFVEGMGFTFSEGTELASGARLLLVSDPVAFAARYPGVKIEGSYDRKLSNGGERLRLETPDGEMLLDVAYDDEGLWPAGPDGLGWTLVPRDPATAGWHGEDWQASAQPGGSPGVPEPPGARPLVVVSEVLANTDDPYEDAVEIVNLGAQSADISGWYLSDDRGTVEDLMKFRIPDGVVLPAGGRTTFYAADFDADGDPNGFGLSSAGEEIYLSSASAGGLTGAIRGFEFPALAENESFGRVQTSDGPDIAPLLAPTFGATDPPSVEAFREGKGAANAEARVGPIVVSEIMYHPNGDAIEWIELHNRSDQPIRVGYTDEPGWLIGGSVQLVIPDGLVVAPGEYLIASGGDPDALRQALGIPASVPVVGPFEGSLDNKGGSILVLAPVEGVSSGGEPGYGWSDRVVYRDEAPWPPEADGDGPSLERLAPDLYGNDPASWNALIDGGTPGRANALPRHIYLSLLLND